MPFVVRNFPPTFETLTLDHYGFHFFACEIAARRVISIDPTRPCSCLPAFSLPRFPAMISRWLTVVCLFVAGSVQAEDGFVSLFDGQTLDGWKQVGGKASYAVEGGEIVGRVTPEQKGNAFLRTEKTYGDFVLRLDLKLDVPGNSGIQFRSHEKVEANGSARVYGYQCEVDPSARAWSGGLYDEARRGWLYDLAGKPEAQKAFKLKEWNSYEIEARGPRLKITLNGIPCADYFDTMDLDGFIALQVHTGKEGVIRWRNVRIKDLGQSSWKPLWDGQTLAGWEPKGGGHWEIDGGTIHGTNRSSEARHGHLFSRKDYGDFAVKLQFLSRQGNSGLYFRVDEQGLLGVRGFQAEIDPRNDIGGLYETEGRGWVVQPKPDLVAKNAQARCLE